MAGSTEGGARFAAVLSLSFSARAFVRGVEGIQMPTALVCGVLPVGGLYYYYYYY